MARSSYIYLLYVPADPNDRNREPGDYDIVPFTVKHELETVVNRYGEHEKLRVERYPDGKYTFAWTREGPRQPVPPSQGRIVPADDGRAWVVRFPKEETP